MKSLVLKKTGGFFVAGRQRFGYYSSDPQIVSFKPGAVIHL